MRRTPRSPRTRPWRSRVRTSVAWGATCSRSSISPMAVFPRCSTHRAAPVAELPPRHCGRRGTPRCRSAAIPARSRCPAASRLARSSLSASGRSARRRCSGPRSATPIDGFPASPLLGRLASAGCAAPGGGCATAAQARARGCLVRRPGAGRAMRAVAPRSGGRLLQGAFGDGLVALADGVDRPLPTLPVPTPIGSTPLGIDAWGRTGLDGPTGVAGLPHAGRSGDRRGLDLPDDTGDPLWAHLLIEAAIEAGYDRPIVLSTSGRPARHCSTPERLASPLRRSTPSTPSAGRSGRTRMATPPTSVSSTPTGWACP